MPKITIMTLQGWLLTNLQRFRQVWVHSSLPLLLGCGLRTVFEAECACFQSRVCEIEHSLLAWEFEQSDLSPCVRSLEIEIEIEIESRQTPPALIIALVPSSVAAESFERLTVRCSVSLSEDDPALQSLSAALDSGRSDCEGLSSEKRALDGDADGRGSLLKARVRGRI